MQCCIGKAIIDNSVDLNSHPECMIRSGRELMIKLPLSGRKPSRNDLKNYNLQSLDVSTGELRNYGDCLTLDDSLWCATWLRRDYENMMKDYRLRVFDSRTGNIVWKSELVFNPQKQLFYCFNHRIKGMAIHEVVPGIVRLSWERNIADNQFAPIHTVTIDGVKNGQIVKQNIDCSREKCQIELRQPTGAQCVQRARSVCIKTKFNLNDGKNLYKKRHMVKTCTIYLDECLRNQIPIKSKS